MIIPIKANCKPFKAKEFKRTSKSSRSSRSSPKCNVDENTCCTLNATALNIQNITAQQVQDFLNNLPGLTGNASFPINVISGTCGKKQCRGSFNCKRFAQKLAKFSNGTIQCRNLICQGEDDDDNHNGHHWGHNYWSNFWCRWNSW